MSASRILLAYDIAQPSRAIRARKVVRDYLDDLQRSVFTGMATHTIRRQFLESVNPVIDPQDNWLIAVLDQRARILSLGAAEALDTSFGYWG